jgi:AcrR family transcriptional regulator
MVDDTIISYPLRERRMARTKAHIQQCALALFTTHGFEKTTVAQVAEQAEVSPMTVFRYFPTKEDLVLTDDFDETLVEALRQAPLKPDPLSAIAQVLLDSLSAAGPAEREAMFIRLDLAVRTPALRSRRWEALYLTQVAIVDGVGGSDEGERFALSVAAGACLSALSTALFQWASEGGGEDMMSWARKAFESLGARLQVVGEDR